MSNKKIECTLTENYHQRIFEPIVSEHWKGKNRKNKTNKKINNKDYKSNEAKDIRENCLKTRKGSLSS